MERDRYSNARNWGRGYASATGMRYADVDPPRRVAEPPYKVSTTTGGPHARERHTHAGIWAAGRALTDHPDSVAVFATEGDFDDALRNMPTNRSAWYSSGGGRYDADFGNVHYQAQLLGDTMDLFSCYPMRGKQYPKRWLNGLLGRRPCRNSQEFWTFAVELDALWEDFFAIRGFPEPCSDTVAGEIAALRDEAEGALRDDNVALSRTNIRKLKAAWDAEAQVAAARAAEIKRAEDARAAEINATRVALNKAIADKNLEVARTHYLKMREFKVFISPPAIAGLKALGIADAASD